MVMDEFHARGNLIDALRDAIEQRVRWRGDRAVGVHMWQAAWSRWGHMDFYKLNWRGYGHAHVHACTCLHVLAHAPKRAAHRQVLLPQARGRASEASELTLRLCTQMRAVHRQMLRPKASSMHLCTLLIEGAYDCRR